MKIANFAGEPCECWRCLSLCLLAVFLSSQLHKVGVTPSSLVSSQGSGIQAAWLRLTFSEKQVSNQTFYCLLLPVSSSLYLIIRNTAISSDLLGSGLTPVSLEQK